MKIWTVEYSLSTKSYHVDTLERVLEHNLMTIARETPKDYLLIGVFRTIDDAHEYIQKHEKANSLSELQVSETGFINF